MNEVANTVLFSAALRTPSRKLASAKRNLSGARARRELG